MNRLIFSCLTLALSGSLFATACELSDPCDPDQQFEYGVCVPTPEASGGASGCEETAGGAGGEVECVEPPNFGARCSEGGDECRGGTVCGAPQLPQCVGLCGPGDPFEDNCPSGLSCTDFDEASVCF